MKTKLIMAIFCLVLAGCNDKETVSVVSGSYSNGVNDALDAFMLLNLEQRLMETNRNFGDMGAIVCRRLEVGQRTHLPK